MSEEFGVDKIIQVDGVIHQEETLDFPIVSLYDTNDTDILNVVIHVASSLLIISSPSLLVNKMHIDYTTLTMMK